MALHYFALYKPYDVLSQFTKEAPQHVTLRDVYSFPPDVYPVGRLDRDSEGLLLLTNDKTLNNKLLNPKFQHKRTYLVQVEQIPTPEALKQLRKGLIIRLDKQDYQTQPAQVKLLETPPDVPERNPPIRHRENIPTAWLELTLTEGKNRQVRRMLAAVGFPVLRLIRTRIEKLELRELKPGFVQQLSRKDAYRLLNV